jgi:hypothetical protein
MLARLANYTQVLEHNYSILGEASAVKFVQSRQTNEQMRRPYIFAGRLVRFGETSRDHQWGLGEWFSEATIKLPLP